MKVLGPPGPEGVRLAAATIDASHLEEVVQLLIRQLKKKTGQKCPPGFADGRVPQRAAH